MDSLSILALQACGYGDGRLTVLVSQAVGRGKRFLPAIALFLTEQMHLAFDSLERRRMHSQEPDRRACPILAK